jgi:hypothetical protein
MLSNWQNIETNQNNFNCCKYYGVEFSPNGNVLYVVNAVVSNLYQYDLTSLNIAATQYLLAHYNDPSSAMTVPQLAPDGKIYVNQEYGNFYPSNISNNYTTNLSVVNNPDVYGSGANFCLNCFSLGGRITYGGFPNMVNYALAPLLVYEVDAGADQTICFGDTIALGSSPVDGILYTWNGSNIVSGENSSEVLVSPAQTTTYYLTLEDTLGTYNCTNRMDSVVVNVQPQDVSVTISADTLFASPGVNYQWYLNGEELNDATSSFYVPTQSGTYSVEITEGKCVVMSEGFDYWMESVGGTAVAEIEVHPNPFYTVATITLFTPQHSKNLSIKLINILGEQMQIEYSLEGKTIKLLRGNLPAGVYFLQVFSAQEIVASGKLIAQ